MVKDRMIALTLCSLLACTCIVSALAGASRDKSATSLASGGMTSEEEALLDLIDVDNAWQHLEYLSGLGEKVAGTSQERFAQEYVYDCMTGMELDSLSMETFSTKSWQQHDTELSVVSPEEVDIEAATYGGCYSIWGTEDGVPYYFGNVDGGTALISPVVHVGYGTADELDAIGSLEGFVALVHREDNVMPYPSVTLEEVALRGASAAIFYGYYLSYPAPDGIKQDGVGGSLPAFSISKNSAQLILDLMKHDTVVVRMEGSADLYSVDNAESVNVVGRLTGTLRPDEYIVVSAHIDTWWYGANDDCSGVAGMLELARLFSEARDSGIFVNERTILFCSFGAEEFGGPSDWYSWLIGSYEFVSSHPEVADGLAIHLNLDMIGFEKTNGPYWLENTWEINGFLKEVIADSKVDATWCNPVYPYSDAWSFAAIAGGSTVQASWVEGCDAYYHTQLDDISQSSTDSVEDILRFYALLGAREDHAIVLPIDFTPTVNWIASNLKSQTPSVPSEADLFDRAYAALRELREQVVAANDLAIDLTSAYMSAQTDAERAAVRAEADNLNQALIEARQTINRWSIGQGGAMGSWDVFLRTGQHVHDYVGLSDAISDLSSGSTNNAISALTGIYSMEWAPLCSPETYDLVMSWMVNDEMYWADDYDQQQAYLDVYWVYLGLVDGTLPEAEAQGALEDMRDGLLIPWLQEDLLTMEWAWLEGADILAQATA